MRRGVTAVLAVLTLAGMTAIGCARRARLTADDSNKVQAQSKKTPGQQFSAVFNEYQRARQNFGQAYSKARTDEERSKIFSEKYPKADEYADRILAIADAAPDDPAALEALIRCIKLDPRGDTSKVMKRLAEKHADDPKLANVFWTMPCFSSPSGEVLLRAVAQKNPDRATRGNATLALAQYLKRRVDLVRLKSTDDDALAKETELLFEQVVKEFGDINSERGRLGELAASELDAIRTYGIGMPCPEIAGADIDGKPFKLSDYKGKVVVVDFWGDW